VIRSKSAGDTLPTRVAVVCVSLVVVSLLVAAGTRASAASSHGSAPSAELLGSDAAAHAAVGGMATIGSFGPRQSPAGSRAVELAAIVLSGLGIRMSGATRPLRRAPGVLDDVGDRWRALLIGAPPALSSF
jgi:hypothetical protein